MQSSNGSAKGIHRQFKRSNEAAAPGPESTGAAPVAPLSAPAQRNSAALNTLFKDPLECDVREMSPDSGWQQWEDLKTVDDFAATMPARLSMPQRQPAAEPPVTDDPFAGVTWRSA